MFYHDTVHCSYDLGTGFWNRLLHTKELSQTRSCYWISPAGELYGIDYAGERGRVKPVSICSTIKLQPSKWDAHYAKCPTCIVTFMCGKIIHHKII